MAKAIYKKYPKAIVHILEKEKECIHTSVRNSGVIHAGIYYSTDSLKAKFWKEGNRRLTKYWIDYHLHLNRCGKFIVASNQQEYEQLYQIYSQGISNGIDIQLMRRSEAMKLEPLLRGYGEDVIWSPSTSVADPKQVLNCISKELDTKYGNYCSQFYDLDIRKIEKENNGDKIEVVTPNELFESKYLINCTGQNSLPIAKSFGFADSYKSIPIKGNYLISDIDCRGYVKSLVYPVPLKNAHFLGVHSTITPSGQIKVGPSATPAWSSENYKGLEKFNPYQFIDILGRYAGMFFSKDIGLLKTLAFQEIPKLSKNKMLESVRKIHDVPPWNYQWYPPGIRAQLIDIRTNRFVQDFTLEYDGYSMHLLNVVSPGWTCASPFADYILEQISEVFRLE